MNYSGTLYPNGEFTVGVVPRKLRSSDILPSKAKPHHETDIVMGLVRTFGVTVVAQARKRVSPLGSSSVPISHTRNPKGLNGITSKGRRMVRNGCHALEQNFPGKRCGFMTLTLPDMSDADWRSVHENWGEITRVFIQWMKRRLSNAGVTPYIVYVTEFQNKRYERTGKPYAHLHICYPSRPVGNYKWYISANDTRSAWSRTVQAFCSDSYTFSASIDTVLVKKSLGAYLSKYLSKGAGHIKRYMESGLPIQCLGHWWGISRPVRAYIQKHSRHSADLIRYIWERLPELASAGQVRWSHYITYSSEAYGDRIIGVAGCLAKPAIDMLHYLYPRKRGNTT